MNAKQHGVVTQAYFTLTNWNFVPGAARAALGLHDPGGPFNALAMTAWIACVACCQVVLFVLWAGWPFTALRNTAARILLAEQVRRWAPGVPGDRCPEVCIATTLTPG